MRHANDQLQDIVEAVQGALQMLVTDKIILWEVRESLATYTVVCNIVWRNERYVFQFTVTHEALADARWHERLKWSVVHGVLCKLADDSKPASSDEVRYIATTPNEVNAS